LVGVVSLWDDIQSLPNKVRILAHFTAISLVFYNLDLFVILPIWGVVIAYFVFIGIINAYNFMDGINGITGVYTLVVLGSLLYVNQYLHEFTAFDFIVYPMIASVVFLFFNFRKKAKCFAGDIGSISIAFWVIYLLLQLVLKTDSILWILFLAVYGTDTAGTIMHRLYLRENVFEAHRHHFYQILSNDYKIQHRIVAVGYGLTQVIVSILVIFLYNKLPDFVIFALILVPLFALYSLKFYLIKKIMPKGNKIPRLIEGGIYTDDRGHISFVNDFKFDTVERFYIIENSEENPVRAWQGHKIDHKYFYCLQGVVKVHYVKIDNWESPSKNLKVESTILKAMESNVFHIPEGYANAIQSLETGSKLISFSTLPLGRASEDDVRFDSNMWKIDE